MTGEVNTWVAGGAGNWGDDANWSLGHVPTATETATFDNTSDNNCAINAAPDVYGINIATGYDGTITQGAVDIALGAGGYAQVAGTFTGDTGKSMICAGEWAQTAGTFTNNKLKLTMSGNGTTINKESTGGFASLTINDNVTVTSSGTTVTTNALTIASGKALTITNGKTLYVTLAAGSGYVNAGSVIGTGTLSFRQIGADVTITLGTVSAPTIMRAASNATANRVFTLGANSTIGSSLTVISDHATNTATLDMAGKTLSATAITVSTRGILTNSGATAACSCSGAFTVSGASSVVSGAIALTYDTYVQSDGTATQVNNWSGGAVTASGGTLTGAGSASVTLTSSGDVNLTGATVTADKLNLVMTGAGKTLTTTATLFGLKASAQINAAASFAITAGAGSHLTTDAGAYLNIANTKVVTLPMYADGATLVPNGIIGGLGTLAITMSDGDISTRLGNILCPLTIASINTAAANRKLTVLDSPSLAAITVSSSDDDKTTTLDLAGKNLSANGITAGTRGVIKGGEGVIKNYGNLDTSAGTWTPETSQYIQAGAGTIKLAAGQSFNDLIIRSGAAGSSLLSDVTVDGIYAHVPEIIKGEFTLTYDAGKEYTGKRRPLQKRIIKRIVWPSLADKELLEEIERVSA